MALSVRIGLASGATTSCFGAFLFILMGQGFLQRSSHAAARLQDKAPELFAILQRNDLQFLYFLVEDQFGAYIELIAFAEKSGGILKDISDKEYNNLPFFKD